MRTGEEEEGSIIEVLALVVCHLKHMNTRITLLKTKHYINDVKKKQKTTHEKYLLCHKKLILLIHEKLLQIDEKQQREGIKKLKYSINR